MEATVKQRLVGYINYKGVSIREFERLSGLSNGYIKSLRNSPTIEKMQSIIRAFPDLNQHWLSTGEGSMLNEEFAKPTLQNIGLVSHDEADYQCLYEENIRLRAENEVLREIVGLQKKTNRIADAG